MNKTQLLMSAIIKSYFQMRWIVDDVSNGWGLVVYGLENLNLKESAGMFDCLNGKINGFLQKKLYEPKKEILDPLTQAIDIVGMNVVTHFWREVYLIEAEEIPPDNIRLKVNMLISELPITSVVMLSEMPMAMDDPMTCYTVRRLQKKAYELSKKP